MGPRLVEHLLYEPEDSGILWIKFNRPERMNALVGTAEENGTVAKVGEYMRAGDDDPSIRVIVLTGVGRGVLFRRESRHPGRRRTSPARTSSAIAHRMTGRMARGSISSTASPRFTAISR